MFTIYGKRTSYSNSSWTSLSLFDNKMNQSYVRKMVFLQVFEWPIFTQNKSGSHKTFETSPSWDKFSKLRRLMSCGHSKTFKKQLRNWHPKYKLEYGLKLWNFWVPHRKRLNFGWVIQVGYWIRPLGAPTFSGRGKSYPSGSSTTCSYRIRLGPCGYESMLARLNLSSIRWFLV